MLKAQRHVQNLAKTNASVAIQEINVQSLVDNCHAWNDLHSSRKLLLWMASNGLECLPLYADYLIRSFSASSSLPKACQIFLKVPNPTAYTWNAIISAHAQHSHRYQALILFNRMQLVGIKADRITFLCILKVCSDTGSLVEGKLIHLMVVEVGFDHDLAIGSTLVHMYGKCATLDEARKVFDSLPNPNVVSWGALIAGYACYGDAMQALQLFEEMHARDLEPEKATFLATLKACGKIGALMEGQCIHDKVVRCGLHKDVAVTSALMDMYGKCTRLLELHKLFRGSSNHDAVSWASIMSAFTEHGGTFSVFDMLEEMEASCIMPDQVIYLCTLRACVDESSTQGRIIHDRIIKANLESAMAVANSLVDMYAKSGSLEEAENVFSKLSMWNLISCSAMISGYVQEGCSFLACDLFEKMQDKGIRPDKVSFLGALRACASLGAICKGRRIHATLIESRIEKDAALGNKLVDMYAKCGSLEEAHKMFDKLSEQDLVSWRALISGYAQQGSIMGAMKLVESMQRQGFKPNDGIYMSVLAGCSHAGLLKEGHFYFDFMRQEHSISPSVEHYNCMIDLLGRAGNLLNAEDTLQTMPVTSNFIGWSTLLNGCRSHSHTELGGHCFNELSRLDTRDATSYMLMSSLYMSVQQRYNARELQKFRRTRQAWKKPGEAWIEVGRQLHEFTVNDCLLLNEVFLSKVNRIGMLAKEHGYLPDLDTLCEPARRMTETSGLEKVCTLILGGILT